MILDSRTLQSTPESGARAGYDGAKRHKGSKVHSTVDTLGHLRALHVTAADEQDRARPENLVEEVQQIAGESIDFAYLDQGYTSEHAVEAAQKHGIRLLLWLRASGEILLPALRVLGVAIAKRPPPLSPPVQAGIGIGIV